MDRAVLELPGVESILSLRGLWLTRDDRWIRYWNTRLAYQNATQTVTDPPKQGHRLALWCAARQPVQLGRVGCAMMCGL